MTILALEFSSSERSVAVWANGQVRGRAAEREGRDTRALALIEASLNQAQLQREQIDCIAIGLGPGSYAGVRIAIALAQGWNLARPVNLLGLSSADCIAAQARAAGFYGRLQLMMDAQRHGFFCATYEIDPAGWRQIAPFHLLETKTINPRPEAQPEGPSPTAPTPPCVVWPEPHGKIQPGDRVIFPDAAMLAQLAAARRDFVAGESLAPIYLMESTFVKASPPRIIR